MGRLTGRKPGTKRGIEEQAHHGTYDADILEVVMAVDAMRRSRRQLFLKASEYFEVFWCLGYRKTAAPMKEFRR